MTRDKRESFEDGSEDLLNKKEDVDHLSRDIQGGTQMESKGFGRRGKKSSARSTTHAKKSEAGKKGSHERLGM